MSTFVDTFASKNTDAIDMKRGSSHEMHDDPNQIRVRHEIGLSAFSNFFLKGKSLQPKEGTLKWHTNL